MENEMVGAHRAMGKRGIYKVLVENLWDRDNLEDPGVDGRVILRWILKKWDGVA
jgi:hypothetical protein